MSNELRYYILERAEELTQKDIKRQMLKTGIAGVLASVLLSVGLSYQNLLDLLRTITPIKLSMVIRASKQMGKNKAQIRAILEGEKEVTIKIVRKYGLQRDLLIVAALIAGGYFTKSLIDQIRAQKAAREAGKLGDVVYHPEPLSRVKLEKIMGNVFGALLLGFILKNPKMVFKFVISHPFKYILSVFIGIPIIQKIISTAINKFVLKATPGTDLYQLLVAIEKEKELGNKGNVKDLLPRLKKEFDKYYKLEKVKKDLERKGITKERITNLLKRYKPGFLENAKVPTVISKIKRGFKPTRTIRLTPLGRGLVSAGLIGTGYGAAALHGKRLRAKTKATKEKLKRAS